MIIFPLVAAGVSTAFSAMLLRRFTERRRLQELGWGVALAMYAIASAMVAIGISAGWTPLAYKTFYLFGAMLNVPWLALGSIALLDKKVVSYAALVIVVALSLFGLFRVGSAHVTRSITATTSAGSISQQVFGTDDIPSGKDAWRTESQVRTLAQYYSTFAYLIVVVIASLTSFKRRGVSPPRDRVRANLLISIGVTVVAAGSTALVKIGRGSAFSIALAVGVSLMFSGFLYAGRAAKPQA